MWQFLAGAFACYVIATDNGKKLANKLGEGATNLIKNTFSNKNEAKPFEDKEKDVKKEEGNAEKPNVEPTEPDKPVPTA